MVKDCGLLVGSQQIMDYLKIALPTFKEFVKLGMPAIKVNATWYAHQKNLDDYFIALTRKTMKGLTDDAE